MLSLSSVSSLVLGSGLLFSSVFASSNSSSTGCRCFPGDSCWPSQQGWNEFNQTVGGKLIATVPIASVCHNSDFGSYDEAACKTLQGHWPYPKTHFESSSSLMAPFFSNYSCNAFTKPDTQCTLGNYISFAVNASGTKDYQDTIAFVRKHNIRLVIRNRVHDYLGKSTGAGALAIWTHHMKDMELVDYKSPS